MYTRRTQRLVKRALCTRTSTSSATNILPCQRHLFDIFDDIHWFNCAYLTPGLEAQRDGYLRGLERKLHPWTVSPPDDFFDDADEFRSLIARLLHDAASPKDIAINSSVSYGMAVVGKHLDAKIAQYLKTRASLNLVLLAEQFPSNFYVWQQLQHKHGSERLQMRTVQRPNKLCSWTEHVIAAIDEHTVLVTVPNVHWTDGSLVDIERIGAHIVDNGYKVCNAHI